MEPFAQPSDVAAIWRPLTDAESIVAYGWLEEASQQVRDEVPDVGGLTVDERIADGSLSADTVRNVVRRMVLRVLQNPESLRAITEQTGPFAVTKTKDSSVSSGEMFISARDMARLMSKRGATGQTAFMINPASPAFS